MEDEIQRLADSIVEQYSHLPKDKRLLIAIAGPPGSGKSTLAYPLTDRINTLLLHHPPSQRTIINPETALATHDPPAKEVDKDDVAICVGLDGWHHTRKELDGFDDPFQAHWRRGAPFTFNLAAYTSFLNNIRLPLSKDPLTIPFPTFSHSLKDPLISPTPITSRHRIIIVEGLYTLLSLPGWKECAEQYDRRIWVEVSKEVCKNRLVRRNFEAGIMESLESSAKRVDAVDMVNGDVVRENRVEPTDIVHSIDNL